MTANGLTRDDIQKWLEHVRLYWTTPETQAAEKIGEALLAALDRMSAPFGLAHRGRIRALQIITERLKEDVRPGARRRPVESRRADVRMLSLHIQDMENEANERLLDPKPMSDTEAASAYAAVMRWKKDRRTWQQQKPSFPPSWPLSYVDTLRLIERGDYFYLSKLIEPLMVSEGGDS